MRAFSVVLLATFVLGAVPARAQPVRVGASDTAAVLAAIAEQDSTHRSATAANNRSRCNAGDSLHCEALAINTRRHTFFVNLGADSVFERRVAEALGHGFQVIPSGVTPRCHDGVPVSAPTGNRIAVQFAFATADSAQLHVTMRCAGGAPPQFMHGSRITYTVARRDSRWVVLSVIARVS